MRASVIIPVWNGRRDLPACLAALAALDYSAGVEVIAVDNASADGSAELVAADFPWVRLVRNDANRGFGGACNQGLRLAEGEMLVLLNQDTMVAPGWLAGLAAALESDPRIGAAGSKAHYPDGSIQHAGGVVDVQGLGAHRGYRRPDQGGYDALEDVDYVTGAALAVRRAAYVEVGGLDDGFGMAYFEDVDWCYRIRAAGWRVVYAPTSVLVHNERSSQDDGSHAARYAFQRNRLRFVLRHWPLARLRGEFLSAERAWLAGQMSASMVAAAQRAYLYNLARVDELAAWRRTFLGEEEGDADALAGLLTELRAALPTRPALLEELAPHRAAISAQHGAELERLAGLLAEVQGKIEEYGRISHSDLPVVGAQVTWLRRHLNQIPALAYVTRVLDFQRATLELVGRTLEHCAQLEASQARLASMLVEYAGESAREVDELLHEVSRLRAGRSQDGRL